MAKDQPCRSLSKGFLAAFRKKCTTKKTGPSLSKDIKELHRLTGFLLHRLEKEGGEYLDAPLINDIKELKRFLRLIRRRHARGEYRDAPVCEYSDVSDESLASDGDEDETQSGSF